MIIRHSSTIRFKSCSVRGLLLLFVAASLVSLGPQEARGAEISLYQSALQTLISRNLFGPSGKRAISGDPSSCSYMLVEQPAVSLATDRLFLRGHFSARAGARVNAACTGPAEEFWFTVSARPTSKGDALQLVDIKLDEVKEQYRPLLELLLSGTMANAIQLNLRAEVQKLLAGQADLKATLPMLSIQSVTTTEAAITARFDFRLEAR